MGFDKGTELTEAENFNLGRYGHEIITSAKAISPPGKFYSSFQVLEEVNIDYKSTPESFNTQGDGNTQYGGDPSQTGIVFPVGFVLLGRLQEIKVNTGKIIAYLG